MGRRGVEIPGVDVEKFVGMLDGAPAEAWLRDIARMKDDLRKLRL